MGSLSENLKLITRALLGSARGRAHVDRSHTEQRDLEGRLAALEARLDDAARACEDEPVFLLSAGWRTGSTLLQRWIMADDDTMLWGEPFHRCGLVESMLDQLRCFSEDWPLDYYAADRFEGDLAQQWVANIYPTPGELVAAQRSFFARLYAEPARRFERSRWGFKETRLGMPHAKYLRWLYPKARFLFLYRNPYDAYASFRGYLDFDYEHWPDRPVLSPRQFGELWERLTLDYIEQHGRVGGLLLRYEDLHEPKVRTQLSEFLGRELPPLEELQHISGRQDEGGPRQPKYVPRLESFLLHRRVARSAARLGYRGLSL